MPDAVESGITSFSATSHTSGTHGTSSAMPSSARSIDDSHVERVAETKRGGATVHVSSTTDGVSIDACITLRAKSKSLEFRTKVDWRASERFLKVDIPMLSSRPGAVRMPVRHGGTAHSEEHTFRRGEIRKLHAPVRTRRRCRLCGCVVNASTYGSDVSPIHRNTASGPVRGR